MNKTFREQLDEILKRAWLKTVPPVGMDEVIWKGYIKGVTGSQAVYITSLVERLIEEALKKNPDGFIYQELKAKLKE